jgi:hypothetical protein
MADDVGLGLKEGIQDEQGERAVGRSERLGM